MNLYLVQLTHPTTGESFYKVGVTAQSAKARFTYGVQRVKDSDLAFGEKVGRMLNGQTYIPDNPYTLNVLHEVKYTLDGDALVAERDLLRDLQRGTGKYWPKESFSGSSECFSADDEVLARVKQDMGNDCDTRNAEAPSELKYKAVASFQAKHIRDPIEKHLFVLKKCREASGP